MNNQLDVLFGKQLHHSMNHLGIPVYQDEDRNNLDDLLCLSEESR